MANQWTEQQRQAIEGRGGDLLVAAAAGSGKTAVLVERIITRIIEEEQEIDRLLVVTFTKAAAAEMSQRIGAAICRRLETDPNNLHLQNQMAFLPRADIKTIHAFCLQVIREYYHIVEIDPAARTADPAEIKLLQKDVLEDLFEQLYAAEDNAWFLALLETFAPATRDDRLKELVLQTHTFAQGSPQPERFLEETADGFHLAEGQTVDDCAWFHIIREGVAAQVEYALYQLERAYALAKGAAGFEAYAKTLAQDLDGVHALQNALDKPYQAWRLAYVAVDFARLPAYRGEEKDFAEYLKELRNEAKDAVKKMGETYFCYSAETQTELIRKAYPVAKGLAALTIRFMQTFAAAKREKNIIDFNDYEHFALQILLDADGRPTAAAEELRGRYDEIMIDEYQDSNIVQELILSAVSGQSIGENNRFMVGDVKQSIYRFRQAMPELFSEKYLRYPAEEGGRERKIILSKNFRSRRNILEGINFIFRQMMCREFGGIAYDAEAALYAGREFPACDKPHGGANELLLIETAQQEDSELTEEMLEMDRRQVEATAIAARIQALLKEGYQVLDGKTGQYRPLQLGDIAILFRSMKNWSAVLEDVFGRAGLAYYAETAEGYFEVPEVETVLHLLRLIDNPRQDIPLLSILHAPIYGLSADELMQVRLGGGKGLYLDCVHAYLEQGEDEELRGKLAVFLEDLSRWRRAKRDLSLHELLRLLYRETGYYDYLGMTAGGALRQANLRLLLEKAEQYEKGSRKGLFTFIRYVEDLKTAEAESSTAKLLGAGENLIHVMTIHKSKGLEFPVVFVSDLGKTFNDMDARSAVIFHHKLGFGMDYTDQKTRAVYRTLSKTALIEATRMENLAEEMRVLYVALTRAKEKLILTGAVKDGERSLRKWAQAAECTTEILPLFRLRRARSYLDWVMPALCRHPQGIAIPTDWEVAPHRFFGETSAWTISRKSREDVLRGILLEQKQAETQRSFFAAWQTPQELTESQKEVFRVLSWRYPQEKETLLPAKLTISEVKRKFQEEQTGELQPMPARELRLPDRSGSKGLTAAEIGTAMHTFLEEADLRQEYSMEQIEALAGEMVAKGRLTAEEGKALRKKELLGFFRSKLAARLRRAEKIEREQPFSLLMQPRELFFGEEYAEVSAKILLNGIIDCYFMERDGIILLDYKTDRIYDEEKLRERYRIQLELYRAALERTLGLPVKEVYLYSFALGREVLL